jgi:hypothetical protein
MFLFYITVSNNNSFYFYVRFKNFQFPGASDDIRKLAHGYLKNNFVQNFLPKPVAQRAAVNPPPASLAPQKKRKISVVATFLDSDDDDEEVVAHDPADDLPLANLVVPGCEELDAYFGLPTAAHVTKSGEEFDVLEWWKTHSHMFPNLSKMARQYLAMPASSAGVERLFSAAGRMHSSFRKNTKEDTLEMQLVVYQNA